MPRRRTEAAAGAGAGDAARQIALGDAQVAYRLRRSARRSIGLVIDAGGLAIAAPQRAPLRDIESVIRRHAAWVLKKLDEWRSRPAALPPPVLADGSRIPFLGGELLLGVRVGRARPRWEGVAVGESSAGVGGLAPTLTLSCREATPEAIAKSLQAALRELARPFFAARLAHYCTRLGVAPPALALSSARTRWGSCSASGIRLNWRLLQVPPTIIDYVVAHEVAHLVEMNHSPRFWSIVEGLYPDWRAARAELRRRAAQCLP